jgi:predicted enzyme related to lactoylglutathione lyase
VRAARDQHGLEVSQDGGAMELVRWSDDIDATFAQAIAAGATVMREPHDFQEGRLRVGWVMDPLGNPLELVQERKAAADGTGFAGPTRERSTVK